MLACSSSAFWRAESIELIAAFALSWVWTLMTEPSVPFMPSASERISVMLTLIAWFDFTPVWRTRALSSDLFSARIRSLKLSSAVFAVLRRAPVLSGMPIVNAEIWNVVPAPAALIERAVLLSAV